MVKKSVEKTLFVAATQLTPVDGHIQIPTALCYEGNDKTIGLKAVRKTLDNKIVNRNFKIQLGQYVLGKLKDENQRVYCEDGKDRSAYDLAKDFFDEVLEKVEGQGSIPNYEKKGLKIMVAEPLSLHLEGSDSAWIKNYRENIERILRHYDSVEFLPEPFAVYQYYRYGLRIPQVVEKVKNIAFIIDFGGGTFDVSIIETTNIGEVTKGGKNSSPHAASSDAVGGFFINQKIAEYLMFRTAGENNLNKTRQCIDCFIRVSKGQLNLLDLNSEKQSFIKNIRRLIELVEYPKIELCQKIVNWDLQRTDCYEKVQVEVPADPFSATTHWNVVTFQGHELRKIFKNDIWDQHLKKAIRSVFKRAEEKLKGKGITVTLISGGSSNIRWLEKLIVTDFAEELKGARPIPLSESFQEIVAKGLAIECARRHYDTDSEFVSVTYNPIRLLLNADDHGIEERTFTSVDSTIDMEGATPGILIPSAQALHNFIEEPLKWRFKVSHPPKHSLKYHFMRPSELPLDEQPSDIEAIYNLDHEVYTPRDAQFDGKLRVELVIKKDGTATPKFIYKTSSDQSSVPECSVTGKPFVIDMTSENTQVDATKYIGFDFGTSNSAICYLTNDVVEMLESKGKDASWSELKDLIAVLPYPVSFAIKKYLSCAMADPGQTVACARQAFEAMFAFAAYIAAAELSTIGGLPDIFKGFTQRSMGPLKKLLDDCQQKMRKKALFSGAFQKIVNEYLADMNLAIDQLTDHKHDSISSLKVNVHQQLICLANICKEAMEGKVFGYVEQCNSHRFKRGTYEGIIRAATDSQPFVEAVRFSSSVNLLKNEPLLIDTTTGNTISLFPLYFVEESVDRSSGVNIYVFDKYDKDLCKFKLVDEDTRINVADEIVQAITEMRTVIDYKTEVFNITIDDIL